MVNGLLVKSVPKGRYGRAEEIADAVLWLCSGAASYVTGQSRAIAFGFFTHRFQAGKLIQAASASFSMRKSAFLRGMSEQINTVRSRIQTGSGSFCNSDVKKIPNAIPLVLRGVYLPFDGLYCRSSQHRPHAR